MQPRQDTPYIIDQKITTFLKTIQQSEFVKSWSHFRFIVHGTQDKQRYVCFQLANLATKYNYTFLDRIQVVIDGRRLNATIIGEHQGLLYINFDTRYYAEPLDGYLHQSNIRVQRNRSGETNFVSETEFSKLYLGFYLSTFNELEKSRRKIWEEQSTFFTIPKRINCFFKANLEYNAAYLDNTVMMLRIMKLNTANTSCPSPVLLLPPRP